MQPFRNNEICGWAALPNIPCHGPAHFAALKNRFVLMLCRLSTTFKWTDGRAPPNTVQFFSRCWRTFFFGCYAAMWNIQVYGWAALPNIPVTAQLNSRRWRIFSFWCYVDIHQRSNERLVVLPKTRSRSFHCVENFFVWMIWSFSKTFELMAGPCSPNTAQFLSRCWTIFVSGCSAVR